MLGTSLQIRECSGELIKFAKEKNIPVILVGHDYQRLDQIASESSGTHGGT